MISVTFIRLFYQMTHFINSHRHLQHSFSKYPPPSVYFSNFLKKSSQINLHHCCYLKYLKYADFMLRKPQTRLISLYLLHQLFSSLYYLCLRSGLCYHLNCYLKILLTLKFAYQHFNFSQSFWKFNYSFAVNFYRHLASRDFSKRIKCFCQINQQILLLNFLMIIIIKILAQNRVHFQKFSLAIKQNYWHLIIIAILRNGKIENFRKFGSKIVSYRLIGTSRFVFSAITAGRTFIVLLVVRPLSLIFFF